MSLVTAKGSFAFPDSGANYAVTGTGFQPKAVLFWLTQQSATGFAATKALSFGWATSATQRGCLSLYAADAVTVGTANGNRIDDLFCIKAITTSAGSVTTTLDADFVSMDADGFTINPGSTSVGAAFIVHWFAIGGSDISNVFAGKFDTATATGNTSYEGVGFTPDCLLILTNTTGAIPRADTAHKMSLGAASSSNSLHQAVSFIESSNAIPSACNSYQNTGEIIHTLNLAGTDNTVASLASFDTDGFTLNYTVAQATVRGFLALALKGGRYQVTVDVQKTTTGTKAKTGIGFQPTGLMVWGTNRAVSSSVDSTLASLSIGATDGTNVGSTWVGSADNVSTTDENQATLTTKILRHATGPSTTDAEASFTSFDADGYTVDWTTADGTARQFVSLMMGSTAAAGAASARNMLLMGVG